MKTFMIAAATVVAGVFASTASAQTVVDSDTIRLCANKGAFGWVVTGVNSTTRDWRTNKALGQAIGDGNCQDGWVISSTVDPRIQGAPSSKMAGIDTSSVATPTGTSVGVVTNDAGRITSTYNGSAPVVLKGTTSGANDKWRLVSPDGNGGGVYKVVRPGNTSRSKGDTLLFTSQMLQDRDRNGNCTTNAKWCRNFRYAASRDTTTTVQDFDVETTKTITYSKTRTFCPSVWTYTFTSPAGEVVAIKESRAGVCTDKKYTVTRNIVSNSARSVTSVNVGDKYVAQ
jgi:hypothetical protein